MYTVYKVVARYRGRKYVSVSPRYSKWRLTYKLNKKTTCIPGTPGIFVFTDLKKAQHFKACCVSTDIFECITSSKPVPVDTNLWVRWALRKSLSFDRVVELWKRPAKQSSRSWWYPRGSHVVGSVTPIRKVK